MNIPYLYDAGALIAIDNDDRHMRAVHALALQERRSVHVPSVVVSQAWRDGRRQVHLNRFLTGCRIEAVGLETAKVAGVLCGRSRTADVVDAVVVAMAASLGGIIWTSDPGDIRALTEALGSKPAPGVRVV